MQRNVGRSRSVGALPDGSHFVPPHLLVPRARKTGVAQFSRVARLGTGRGEPLLFKSGDFSHFTPVPLIRLSPRHFDITLGIIVDYARNERGVIGPPAVEKHKPWRAMPSEALPNLMCSKFCVERIGDSFCRSYTYGTYWQLIADT